MEESMLPSGKGLLVISSHCNIKVTSHLFSIGRKKKSAAAKLAQKKRQNSDGGSEFGSNASLQKETEAEYQTQSNTEATKSVQGDIGLNDKVNDKVNIDQARGITSYINKQKSRQDIPLDTVKTSSDAPKPYPRKLTRQRKRDEKAIPDELKDGIVVSIYDQKVDKPTPKTSEEKVHVIETIEVKDAKRELFPVDKKPIRKTQNEETRHVSDKRTNIGLNPLSELRPLEKEIKTTAENVELSPAVPMDLDSGSDDDINNNGDEIGKNAPSDATVHRFRAMRMTPDRTKSEESLKNVNFVPKPPSTPKSGRKNSNKGEKRNREANSSGEETDIEAKKQNSIAVNGSHINTSLSELQPLTGEKMEIGDKQTTGPNVPSKGIVLHPNAMEVSDFVHENFNQNMNSQIVQDDILDKGSHSVNKTSSFGALSGSSSDTSPDKYFNKSPDKLAFESSPDKPARTVQDSEDNNYLESKTSLKKLDKKKGKKSKSKASTETIKLAPLDGGDLLSPGKDSVDTLGSASDLKAITENYREVLQEKSPGKVSDTPSTGTSLMLTDRILPEPKPSSGKLAPIQPKNLPPPLPQDMKSTSMRTTYKADPAYTMSKLFAKSFSGVTEAEKSHADSLSQKSLLGGPVLYPLSTREARNR